MEKIKSSEIVAKATEKIPEEIRLNYTYGNIYILDEIDCYITELISDARKAGLMKQDMKKRINSMPGYVRNYRNFIRNTMSEDLYIYISDNVIDTLHDSFEHSLQILYFSFKRQIDKAISDTYTSNAITDASMIYLLASFERQRDEWYCAKVNELSGIPMSPIHDQHISAIRQSAFNILKMLMPNDVSLMDEKEIKDAFNIFKNEINTSKIEFKHERT